MNLLTDLIDYIVREKQMAKKDCEVNFATPHFSYWQGRFEVLEEILDYVGELKNDNS